MAGYQSIMEGGVVPDMWGAGLNPLESEVNTAFYALAHPEQLSCFGYESLGDVFSYLSEIAISIEQRMNDGNAPCGEVLLHSRITKCLNPDQDP